MPWLASAAVTTTPKNKPTTMPRSDPMIATMMDSHRTMRRTWRRLMPTALSSPISRVRSKTDNARVFVIPNTAMITASTNRALNMTSSVLTWSSCDWRYSA